MELTNEEKYHVLDALNKDEDVQLAVRMGNGIKKIELAEKLEKSLEEKGDK